MPQTTRQFCIHGHFYQPPREDPWLGRILVESSAAPMRHWNERIVGESYEPVGWAHRLGAGGAVSEIMNCYEWMSFNVGPTLMTWLRREAPRLYERLREADAASCRRWGHGNAMAQVYHHAIMPLASALDKELETVWAIRDFEEHFGRKPEGMWLAECAVDVPTLEVLAKEGVRFVILAPRQAEAVAPANGAFTPVDGDPDVTRPYRADLPSGRSIAVFFYHGALSQAVAFERLLENGEAFWNRIKGEASAGFLMLATDGETYGHHFPFGEMALAHVLARGREGGEGLGLSNPASFLAANPPEYRVKLREPSSWSCVHGVERWRSDCGCKDGGHPDWNQRWRGPLREALTAARLALDEHYFAAGRDVFIDAGKALRDYGRVLANGEAAASYIEEHVSGTGKGREKNADRAWKLLTMQEQALASFASCAWFFDDVSRIEPVNGMTYMWRAMELAIATGGPDLRASFSAALGRAASNKPEEGTGADILARRVVPRGQDAASLCLLALTLMAIDGVLPGAGEEGFFSWPAFFLKVRVASVRHEGGRAVEGEAVLGTPLEKAGEAVAFTWKMPGGSASGQPYPAFDASEMTVRTATGGIASRTFASLPRRVREYVGLALVEKLQRGTAEKASGLVAQLLHMVEPWEEGQRSMPYAWDWTTATPHLLAACVLEGVAEEARREQAVAFLRSLGICASTREYAWRMVEKELLRELAGSEPDWRGLAGRVHRARRYLPEINLWAVQNAFADHAGKGEDKVLLGSALGFSPS